jgi:hypothetical protein
MITYGCSGRKAKRTKKEGEEKVLHFSLLKKMKKRGSAFSNRLSKNIIRPPLTNAPLFAISSEIISNLQREELLLFGSDNGLFSRSK